MKKPKNILYVLLGCLFLFTSCSKEEGPMGPEGPQGDQGETGTANVIYSEWEVVQWDFDVLSHRKEMYFDIPQITDDFIEKGGVVLMYIKFSFEINNEQQEIITPLPYGDLKFEIWTNSPSGNELAFIRYIPNPNLPVRILDDGKHFIRYVLIPGGVHARPSNPLPDFSDYQAVCEYYGIPE